MNSENSKQTTIRLDMGHIERFAGRAGEYVIPNDEALIFINDDNEKTLHLQSDGGDALQLAAEIVRAVNSHDDMLAALKALVAMVEDSAAGLVHQDTREKFRPGISDMELKPDGGLLLSDVRAIISRAEGLSSHEQREQQADNLQALPRQRRGCRLRRP